MSNGVGGMMDAFYGMEFQLLHRARKSMLHFGGVLVFFSAFGIIPTRSRRGPDRNPYHKSWSHFV